MTTTTNERFTFMGARNCPRASRLLFSRGPRRERRGYHFRIVGVWLLVWVLVFVRGRPNVTKAA